MRNTTIHISIHHTIDLRLSTSDWTELIFFYFSIGWKDIYKYYLSKPHTPFVYKSVRFPVLVLLGLSFMCCVICIFHIQQTYNRLFEYSYGKEVIFNSQGKNIKCTYFTNRTTLNINRPIYWPICHIHFKCVQGRHNKRVCIYYLQQRLRYGWLRCGANHC